MSEDIQPAPGEVLLRLLENRRSARDLVLEGADLRGIQLARLRADGLVLEGADLRDAGLSMVRWRGVVLRDARLDHADLSDANLLMCDLDQARASAAKFVRARFENSTARGARLEGADFTGASLTDSDLSRASLRGAKLVGISAEGLDLRGADLRGANLRDAVLTDADLRGADLSDAELEGADFGGADVSGAIGLSSPQVGAHESTKLDLPSELTPLAEAMTPLVLELLRTAGRKGYIDEHAAQRLLDDVARLPTRSTAHALHPRTFEAVTRTIEALGDDILPSLLDALQRPNEAGPPPEVMDMIGRLGRELSLDDASPEAILERLTGRPSEAGDDSSGA